MKIKKIIKIVLVSIVAMVVIVVFAFKSYYYSKINNIKLPEGTRTIKVEISISDVYGYHVCAEKIVETALSWDELSKFVIENNKEENVHIFSIMKDKSGYQIEWDDYGIDPDWIKGKEKEGMNYYLITNNTPYFSWVY